MWGVGMGGWSENESKAYSAQLRLELGLSLVNLIDGSVKEQLEIAKHLIENMNIRKSILNNKKNFKMNSYKETLTLRWTM
jgi:hypothetical protein